MNSAHVKNIFDDLRFPPAIRIRRASSGNFTCSVKGNERILFSESDTTALQQQYHSSPLSPFALKKGPYTVGTALQRLHVR